MSDAWQYAGPDGPPKLVFPGSGGGAYSGPGDVISWATAWWGLRAYSAATAGNKAIRIVRASDSTQQDFNTLSNGNLDVASIATFLTATTGKIVTLYDQTGNGLDVTQTTDANRPSYTASAIGSLPGALFVRSNQITLSSVSALTLSQPFSLAAVAKRTETSFVQAVMSRGNSGIELFANNTSGDWRFTAGGSSLSVSVTEAGFHAMQSVGNSASSSHSVDGTTTSGNAGANSFSSSTVTIGAGPGNFQNDALDGTICECGIWPSAFNSTQITNMNNNQHTYWGF